MPITKQRHAALIISAILCAETYKKSPVHMDMLVAGQMWTVWIFHFMQSQWGKKKHWSWGNDSWLWFSCSIALRQLIKISNILLYYEIHPVTWWQEQLISPHSPLFNTWQTTWNEAWIWSIMKWRCMPDFTCLGVWSSIRFLLNRIQLK